ncbi:MAG TPA: GntR family transcriptional regulator [Candidatus Cloacimonadota bacterium]|nr:GntR family transcriptional regulator [Candidatus Cloacimonadota bacterium]HPS39009.1 GntR family transcriptional regulator [Candidatus Cloacimonadota bacterium]
MKLFNEDSPIYIQLRKHIQELILNRVLQEEDAIPSLRVMARDYSLNPITVANAVGALVEEGILYKKRGVGIYVSPGAREHIISHRSETFVRETLEPALKMANQLEIPRERIDEIIESVYGGTQ